jgi:hypothetical protein
LRNYKGDGYQRSNAAHYTPATRHRNQIFRPAHREKATFSLLIHPFTPQIHTFALQPHTFTLQTHPSSAANGTFTL